MYSVLTFFLLTGLVDIIRFFNDINKGFKLHLSYSRVQFLTENRLEQNEGNVCGRLLVMVVEAENLQASSATGKISVWSGNQTMLA